MTVREKIDSFNSIDDLCDYLDSLGENTEILREAFNNLDVFKDEVEKFFHSKILQDIRNDTLGSIGI